MQKLNKNIPSKHSRMFAGDLKLLRIFLCAFFNMIADTMRSAEVNDGIGTVVIKCNMIRISGNGFAVM